MAIVVALLGVPSSARALDPRIERSQDRLEQARDAAAGLSSELDRAAADYEEARAHAERLADEQAQSARNMVRAERRVATADAEVRDQLVILFKRPELRMQAFSRAALAGDLGESLHRIELIDQLAHHGAQVLARADRVAGRVRAADRDYRVVSAGVDGAIRDRRDTAADLAAGLAKAQTEVREAEQRLAATQATVEAEAERRRRELRARAGIVGSASPTLPPVDGKFCPVGTPNAFSDSWGAPRSGGRSHEGVDMFAAYGMSLYAVEDGTIRTSDNSLGGVSIHLDGDSGDSYYYAHLSKRLVVTGERVQAGQLIGANGNSGNARSTPPHLHFQYHPGGGSPVNPYPLAFALCRS